MLPFLLKGNCYYLNVKVFTNASRQGFLNGVTNYKDKAYLKLYINSSPVDGKANKEITEFLSKLFNIKKICIRIISGQFDKYKIILIKPTDNTEFNKVGDIINSLVKGIHNVKDQ